MLVWSQGPLEFLNPTTLRSRSATASRGRPRSRRIHRDQGPFRCRPARILLLSGWRRGSTSRPGADGRRDAARSHWEVGDGSPGARCTGSPTTRGMLPLAEAFAAAGRRVVCPALPGYSPRRLRPRRTTRSARSRRPGRVPGQLDLKGVGTGRPRLGSLPRVRNRLEVARRVTQPGRACRSAPGRIRFTGVRSSPSSAPRGTRSYSLTVAGRDGSDRALADGPGAELVAGLTAAAGTGSAGCSRSGVSMPSARTTAPISRRSWIGSRQGPRDGDLRWPGRLHPSDRLCGPGSLVLDADSMRTSDPEVGHWPHLENEAAVGELIAAALPSKSACGSSAAEVGGVDLDVPLPVRGHVVGARHASTGQAWTQALQSMHSSGSMCSCSAPS